MNKKRTLTDYLLSKLALADSLSWRKWERSKTHRTPYFLPFLTSLFVYIFFALISRSLQPGKAI